MRSFNHKVKRTKTMGALLSQLVGKLLGDPPPSVESEVDHNACICCGTMNVTEVAREGTEEEKQSTE